MQADISKPFRHPRKHYRRVLMQQGRVQLDADWNEQVDILLHYLQSLAADLIGPHGTPVRGGRPGTGFDIEEDEDLRRDFLILPGHYYVNGVLCENERVRRYRRQPDFPDLTQDEELEDDGQYVVYLDVWERHITYVEDPRIREIALGGPDTTTRSRLVWQVKVLPIGDDDLDEDGEHLEETPEAWVRHELLEKSGVYSLSTARLCARVRPERPSTDPCRVSPSSRYRGLENQLYRVEIHEGWGARPHRHEEREEEEKEHEHEERREEERQERGWRAERNEREVDEGDGERDERHGEGHHERGRAEHEERERRSGGEQSERRGDRDEIRGHAEREDEDEDEDEERGERPGPPRRGPTFKWSRENASVIFPIRSIDGSTLRLGHLGHDAHLGLQTGDLVEVIDDAYDLRHRAEPLFRVAAPPDPIKMTVALDRAPTVRHRLRHPFLRRWDQRPEHGVTLRDGAIPIDEDTWIPIEDGIQVRFQRGRNYRTGDYWLIPARTATGKIEWPRDEDGEPECLRPSGIDHYYAPLARISVDEGEIEVLEDYRRAFLLPWERIEEEDQEESEGHRKEHREEEEEEAEGRHHEHREEEEEEEAKGRHDEYREEDREEEDEERTEGRHEERHDDEGERERDEDDHDDDREKERPEKAVKKRQPRRTPTEPVLAGPGPGDLIAVIGVERRPRPPRLIRQKQASKQERAPEELEVEEALGAEPKTRARPRTGPTRRKRKAPGGKEPG